MKGRGFCFDHVATDLANDFWKIAINLFDGFGNAWVQGVDQDAVKLGGSLGVGKGRGIGKRDAGQSTLPSATQNKQFQLASQCDQFFEVGDLARRLLAVLDEFECQWELFHGFILARGSACPSQRCNGAAK
ncbi:MAG: hypothetical protein R3E58_05030 [Phycisphaerae bacterium]